MLTIILIAFTGMRREEALGLTWGDVNFEKDIISIRRARTSAGNDIIIKKPKTSSSIRVVSMPNRVKLELINSIVAQMKSVGRKPNASSFIIAKADGMPCRLNYMSMLFRELANELGFTHITLHGLRHTFASLANNQGYTMFDISKLLGTAGGLDVAGLS